MFDYYVVSLVLSGIALLVSLFVAVAFVRAARDVGKEPATWAAVGWAVYILSSAVAGKLLFLAAWLWERGMHDKPGIALGDIFRTSWFLEAVPAPFSAEPTRLFALLCGVKLAMIAVGLLVAEIVARAGGLKKPAGFDHQARTVSFLGAAAALVLVVWATVPATLADDAGEIVGQLLYPELKREAVASIQIVKFNEEKAAELELELQKLAPRDVAAALKRKPDKAEADGPPRWYISSHSYYPTEAKGLTEQEKEELAGKDNKKAGAKTDDKEAREEAERRAAEFRRKSQLAQALGSLVGLKIEDMMDSSPSDHAGFGVVDPKNRKEGSRGCGTRVVLKGSNGATLLALIVGKAVPNRPEMRFVRRVDEDAVFVTQIDPRHLPVRFAAWIEPDLLKLNVLHARGLDLSDFSFEGEQPEMSRHLSLASDDGSAWRLVMAGEAAKNGRMTKQTIPEGKELDSMKVSDVAYALRDIEIIDVRRKPALLSQVLRGDTQGVPREAFRSLAESLADHGFYLDRNLYPRDGEIHCQMDDGVRYVLKFGSTAPATELAAKEVDELLEKQVAGKDADPEAKPDKDKAAKGKTRYLFVMVDLNDEVAEAYAKKEAAKGKAPKSKDDGHDHGMDDGHDHGNPEGKGNADDGHEHEKPEGKEKADGKPAEETKEKPAAESRKSPVDDSMTAMGEQPDDGADKAAGENAAAPAKDAVEKPADAKEKPAAAKKEEAAEEQDDEAVQEILERSRKRANELNARFADWYYVISDETYQKLHVPLDKLLRDKPSEKPADGMGDAHGPGDDHDHGAEKPPTTPLQEFDDLKRAGPGQ